MLQSYRASVIWATPGGDIVPLPALPGFRLSVPSNWVAPTPIGNSYQVHYNRGLRSVVLDVSLVIRDAVDEVLSFTGDFQNPAFLDYFLTRGSTSVYGVPLNDTPAMGTFYIFDGLNYTVMNGVKADSFSISTSKGDMIRFNARFVGSNATTLYPGSAGYVDLSSVVLRDNTPILMFQAVEVSDSDMTYNNSVWQVNLTAGNSTVGDYMLAGSGFAHDNHAGTPTVALSLLVQSDSPFIDNASNQTNPTPIYISITGNNGQCIFTVPNAINQTRDNIELQVPRVLRTHAYVFLGSTNSGIATSPLYSQSSY